MKLRKKLIDSAICLLALLSVLAVAEWSNAEETDSPAAKKASQDTPKPPRRRTATAAQSDEYNISNNICVNCHSKTAYDIERDGGKHKTVIGCQDCHVGHPPMVRKIIPTCDKCHTGKPHFKSGPCGNCHMNPHNPLFITIVKDSTEACLTCHTEQIDKLRTYKSKHTSLQCTTCHDVHRKIPGCFQCHKPHTREQVAADCKKCHKAHMPKEIVFNDKTPSRDCVGCHKKVADVLAGSAFKHKNVSCVACHLGKHRTIPECQKCHAGKHRPEMLSKFPKCTFCHGSPHDLYDFKRSGTDGGKPAVKKP